MWFKHYALAYNFPQISVKLSSFSRIVTPHLSRASSDCGDSTYYYFTITILRYCSKNNTVVVALTENCLSICLIESAIT